MNERIHSPDSYHAPWEKIFGRILTPFEEFIHQQAAGGLVLIGCTVVALVLANGPLAERYADLLHAHVTIGIGRWELDHSLHHWINDGWPSPCGMLVSTPVTGFWQSPVSC